MELLTLQDTVVVPEVAGTLMLAVRQTFLAAVPRLTVYDVPMLLLAPHVRAETGLPPIT